MTEEDFTKRLASLRQRIESLPADRRESLYALVEQTQKRQSELTRDTAQSRDALRRLAADNEASHIRSGSSHARARHESRHRC